MSERFISLEERDFDRRMAYVAEQNRRIEAEKAAEKAAMIKAQERRQAEQRAEEAKQDARICAEFEGAFKKQDSWNP